MRIADSYKSQHERIKKNIRDSYMYFQKNYDRFHRFRKYLFQTTIDENQETTLIDQGKPVIEFNILPSSVNRLLGEFAKHEPSIEVRPANGIPINPELLEIIEGHIRHINYEANKACTDYEVYKDLLSGGFSVFKVYTDWSSPMSFDQIIVKRRAFDPTLCGFDPLAREPHKADGRWSFELYPMTEEDFKHKFQNVDITNLSYLKEIEGFSWSYKNSSQDKMILVAEYFEKEMKKTKIVKLANGRVMTAKNYEKLEKVWAEWEASGEVIEQIPKIVGKSRMTELQIINRYMLNEDEIFKHEQTDWSYLPHVFVTGNSAILQEGNNNSTYEHTTPYIYHAKGIQDLKNFAGQCLGQYLDSLIQHKFIVKKEAIPQQEDYLKFLEDVQHAGTVVVQAYSENNPDKPIPDPIREVVNNPPPAEVMGTFAKCDEMSQMILGTFDAALVNDQQLSGIAVIESATQSNAAAFPYINGYLQADTQCANIMVDLFPKYINKPFSLPVVNAEGKKDYVGVNGKNEDGTNQPKMEYDEKAINVEISAGVNYAIAKNKALTQIFAMMQASPTAAEFFSTEGFPLILDNMEFHGSDIAKKKAEEWLEQKKNQPPQPSPEQMKMQAEMAKMQQKGQELQSKQQMHMATLQVDIMRLQADQAKLMKDIKLSEDENWRENKRAEREHETHLHDTHLKHKEMEHKHLMDHHSSIHESVKLHHEINQAKHEHKKKEE